jgi:translation initiation factor IF-1
MAHDKIEVEGKVINEFKGQQYQIELGNGHLVLARLCGRMRLNRIRVLVGDVVLVELSPYDLNRGRITHRF